MSYYHDHPEYRIGDEIQTTALVRYLLSKGHLTYYKDVNPYISAIQLFPDNLVAFASENVNEFPPINPINLWYWNPLCRMKGIYTSLSETYNENQADLELVFVPVLETTYNVQRQVDPQSAYETFVKICDRHKDVTMIIDQNKRHILNLDHPNVFYSDNIYKTFELVRRSKIYVGTNTGITHYAGALRHPRMILAYPDEMPLHEHCKWHRPIIADTCQEPEINNMILDSLPCCDPNFLQVCRIENNQLPIDQIIECINRL